VKGGGGWDVFPVVRPACLTGSLLVPTYIVILKGQLHEGMGIFKDVCYQGNGFEICSRLV
jgi:hypothetical protein